MGSKKLEKAQKELISAAKVLEDKARMEYEFIHAFEKVRAHGGDPLLADVSEEKTREAPSEVAVARRKYEEAKGALLKKLSSASEDFEAKFNRVQAAASDLLAAGYKGALPDYVWDKEKLNQFVFWAKYWKKKTGRAEEARLPAAILDDDRKSQFLNAMVADYTPPYEAIPVGVLLPPGDTCVTTGTFTAFLGPGNYLPGGNKHSLPVDLVGMGCAPVNAWFHAVPFTWTDPVESVKGWEQQTLFLFDYDRYPPWIYGWVGYYTDIDVNQTGEFRLSVHSYAQMWPVEFDGECREFNERFNVWHSHELGIWREANDGVSWLSPSYEDRVTGFRQSWGSTSDVGLPNFPWTEVLINGQRTNASGVRTDNEKTVVFNGPCKIRIYELAEYFGQISGGEVTTSGVKHTAGKALLTGGLGYFGPLCYSLKKVSRAASP